MSTENNTPAQTPPVTTPEVTKQPSHSERFTNAVLKEFTSNAGEVSVTPFQRKLIQNYFIKLDSSLKDADRKRMAKREEYRESLAYSWENINMAKLAVDVVAFSSVGLDPAQPNHINLIPYKNSGANKYDITFIMGYRGLEIKAMKYGFEAPDDVIIEVVYAKDKFKSIKKSWNNRIENYEFEIEDDFDRGEVVGGFYYHVFNDFPEKNKLKTFSVKDILKRKPEYASAEFWGGEKDKWENGQKVGKEQVEGWFDEMAYKTIARAAYNSITIDSEKIDEHYLRVMQSDVVATQVRNEIDEKANKTTMDFEEAEVVEPMALTESSQQPVSAEEPIVSNVTPAKEEGPGF